MINLVNYVDLSDWKTKNQIVFELHRDSGINISPDGREWREAVEKWNKAFANHEVPFYITHSNNMGYKATIDYQEAKMARNDYVKRAINMMKKARECDLAFQQQCNYQIDFEKGELV
jgi:hypothetical protein